MTPTLLIAMTMVATLLTYFLLGGADFGGGVWDLLASGPRKKAQRALIEKAIGPIWEANHVWLILATVLLFGGFPVAFALLATALHVPLTIFLLAIVFRGTAFVFRAYDGTSARRRWGGIFSVTSVLGPVLLGATVGTLASGVLRIDNGTLQLDYFEPWLRRFPLAVGLFALALASSLAASYLCVEAGGDSELRDDFRRRALWSQGAVWLLAAGCYALSFSDAPLIAQGLTRAPWSPWLAAFTFLSGAAATVLLVRRRFGLARLAVAAQALGMLLGWALAQYPFLIPPVLTLESAASNPTTMRILLYILVGGAPILGPSLYLLFRVFKSEGGAPTTPAA